MKLRGTPGALARSLCPHDSGITITDTVPDDVLLRTTDLFLRTPDAKTELVQGLNLRVEPGESVLLMGPSGSGKTSLLRALAGLWSSGKGEIGRAVSDPMNKYHDLFFVPQKPYMVCPDPRMSATLEPAF